MFKIKTLSVAAGILITFSVFAQKKEKTTSETGTSGSTYQEPYEINKKIYAQALSYNDIQTAKHALYNMIALRKDENDLKDTLAYLFFNASEFMQVILVGQEILAAKPAKADILELVAVSQQNAGMIKEALESFEKLYSLTKNIYHQYNIASLQYMLKRFGECTETLNLILGQDDVKTVISIADTKGEAQKVPIKAAAFNMRGVIALDLNKEDVAKQNFEKAVEIFPDFRLAQSNMERLKKPAGK